MSFLPKKFRVKRIEAVSPQKYFWGETDKIGVKRTGVKRTWGETTRNRVSESKKVGGDKFKFKEN